jgi:hypothetical protein
MHTPVTSWARDELDNSRVCRAVAEDRGSDSLYCDLSNFKSWNVTTFRPVGRPRMTAPGLAPETS